MGLAAAIGLLAAPDPAVGASPRDEAETLIKKANELRASGDEQSALPLLRRAYEIFRSPRTAVQLGLAEQDLGRWPDAEAHLAEGLKSPADPFIKKNRAIIEDSLRKVKTRVASVDVTGEPAGAEVLVNGRLVGRLPLAAPVRVGAGLVDVEMRAPGYKTGVRSFTLQGGDTQPVVLRLERDPTAASAAAAPPSRATGAASPARAAGAPAPVEPGAAAAGAAGGSPGVSGAGASGATTGTVPRAGEPADSGPSTRPWGWQRWAAAAAAGGAVIAGGASVYGYFRYEGTVDEFRGLGCTESQSGGVLAPAGFEQQCKTRNVSYRNAKTLTYVALAAAGALAATSVVLYLTAPPRDARAAAPASASTQWALTCGAAPASGSVLAFTCEGRF